MRIPVKPQNLTRLVPPTDMVPATRPEPDRRGSSPVSLRGSSRSTSRRCSGGWRARPGHILPLLGCLLVLGISSSALGASAPQEDAPPPVEGAPAVVPGGTQEGGGQGGPTKKIRIEGDNVIFAMDEKEGVPFVQFVKFAQKITGKTFHIDYSTAPELDPRTQAAGGSSPQHTIQLIGSMTIKKTDFFDFFQTLLFIKNWAIVPRGSEDTRFYDLIKKNGQRAIDIKKGVVFVPEEELSKYANQTGTYILTTVKLKYIDANLAATTLRGNFSDQQGLDQLIAIAGSPTLMIAGFGPSVNLQHQILKIVDTKQEYPQATMKVIPLEYSAVDVVEPILSELLSRTGAPQRQQGQIPPEEQVPIKIIPNPNNQSLIVYAHRDKISEIENMIVQLDVKYDGEEQSNYHIINLRNTLAKDMRDIVSQFVTQSATQERQAQAGRGGAPGAAGARREATPVIMADEKSNSLLVSASKTQYQRLKDLIFKLDVRQPQVLIEMALVELGTQDIERIGIELGLLSLPTEGSSEKNPFGFTSFGLSSFQDTDGNGLPDTRLPDLSNPLRGLTGGIISGSDFDLPVIVNLLKSNTTANVLSIPSVLVNNNEDAIVLSTDSFPTTDVTQGNVTSQQSFGGFQEAGIDLRISPSISEGDHLKISLFLEVSKFQGTVDTTSAVPPPKTTRQIQTVVTMPTGHTMILGGVIEDQSSDTDDGIPFLKDLPLIGIFFRSQEKTNRKTNLYFFLTPHILNEDDFSDLAELTFRKKLEAAQYIGHRRLRMVDREWQGSESMRLEDSQSTIDDLDRMGGFNIPTYARPPQGEAARKPDDLPQAPDTRKLREDQNK